MSFTTKYYFFFFFFPLKETKSDATSDYQILVFIIKPQIKLYQDNFNYNKIYNLFYICGYTSHYNQWESEFKTK